MTSDNLAIKQFNNLPHICQSPEWGEVKTRIGTPAVQVGDLPAGRQGVQFTLHDVPLLPFKVGYCPKVDPEKIDWEKLKAAGREHRCIFVKIEPNEVVNRKPARQSLRLQALAGGSQIVNRNGITRGRPIFAAQTILLDLTKSEEELMAGMKSKTRYNVRLAGRKGVVVKERNDEEGLEIFLRLQRETAERQGFFIHPDSYYRTVWKVLHPKGMAHLLIASLPFDSAPSTSFGGSAQDTQPATPLVAWMLLRYKDTFYYPYGGSSTKFRNYMPSNLIMWEAIKLGKRLGCKVFDMWGATDDKSDPWYGFTRFKLGYGGEMVSFPGAYDLVLKPFLYYPFIFADRLRWWILGLLK